MYFKKGDILIYLLLAGILWLSIGGFHPQGNSSTEAIVEIGGEELYRFSLKKEGQYLLKEFSPPVEVTIREGEIAITHNDCPQQVCMRMGSISRPGQTIVCVPKKILIYIPTHEETTSPINAITG